MGTAEIIAVVVVAGAAALAQSLTGFGFGLLIVPPLVMLLGAKEAVLVSNVLSTCLVVVLVGQLRRDVDWRTWGTLMGWSLIGMPAGLLILARVDPAVLQVIIAVNVIVFTVLWSRGMRIGRTGFVSDSIAGILSGVLRTSTSMSGPPIVIYLQGQGRSPAVFRATLSAVFLAGGLLAMGTFGAAGQFTRETWVAAAVGLPAVLAGMVAGSRLYARVDEARFRRLIEGLLFVSAALAIVSALLR
ncbi:MAG: sulfite exporter TauE/SafE family protein [Tepidiformaceae bacterium]